MPEHMGDGDGEGDEDVGVEYTPGIWALIKVILNIDNNIKYIIKILLFFILILIILCI